MGILSRPLYRKENWDRLLETEKLGPQVSFSSLCSPSKAELRNAYRGHILTGKGQR